jgi:hypothetical protein
LHVYRLMGGGQDLTPKNDWVPQASILRPGIRMRSENLRNLDYGSLGSELSQVQKSGPGTPTSLLIGCGTHTRPYAPGLPRFAPLPIPGSSALAAQLSKCHTEVCRDSG